MVAARNGGCCQGREWWWERWCMGVVVGAVVVVVGAVVVVVGAVVVVVGAVVVV